MLYLSRRIATVLSERVHAALGDRDETKAWLAACLLKTIVGNQRWHKSLELIDDLPGATSWLTQQSVP
jgi:hypothetical protein